MKRAEAILSLIILFLKHLIQKKKSDEVEKQVEDMKKNSDTEWSKRSGK